MRLQIYTPATILVAAFAHHISASEPLGPHPGVQVPKYVVQHVLRTDIVTAIAQDATGFLWLGTSSGLVRFDGTRFERWGDRGEPLLPTDTIIAVFVGSDDSIWLGYSGIGGVSRIRNSQLRNYGTDDGISAGGVFAFLEDRDGVIWAGGRAGLASLQHDDHWVYASSDSGLPHGAVFALYEDRSGALWVAMTSGVFRREDRAHRFEKIASDFVRDFGEDAAGDLWAATPDHGLRRVNPTPANPLAHSEESPCGIGAGLRLLDDPEGHIWIGTSGNGVWEMWIDGPTGIVNCDRLTTQDDVAASRVLALFGDTERNVWVGTDRGLFRIFQPAVRTLTHLRILGESTSLVQGQISAVAATEDGRVWIGTEDGVRTITPFDNDGFDIQTALPGQRVTAIATNPDDSLWIATSDGLRLFADGHTVRRTVLYDVGQNWVFSLTSDSRGIPWFCEVNNTAVYYIVDGTVRQFDGGLDVRTRSCSAVYGDRTGRIWIGFEDGSIALKRDNRVEFYPAAAHGRVGAFYQDGAGDVWIATNKGLARFRDGHFSSLTVTNGLPSRRVSAIVQDDGGHLWLATDRSILRLVDFDQSTAETSGLTYTLYDASDGLTEPPAPFGSPTAVRARDGRLWFATQNGLAIINPSDITASSSPVAITARIEQIIADNQALEAPFQDLTLPPRTSNLEFEYSALAFKAASKIRFDYMLDGFDKGWIHAGTRQNAFYTNVPPGEYRFRVQALLDGSPVSAAESTFAVATPFYRSIWFLALSVTAIGLVTCGVWRLRLRILSKRFAAVLSERARIGREIHDTVLQSMAGVALDLEAIARKVETKASVAIDDLRRVRRELEDHIAEARQSIYDLRATASTSEGTLAESLRKTAASVLSGCEADFELSMLGRPIRHSPDVEQQLTRIAQEALRNSARHSGARHIKIDLRYEDERLTSLTIRDDGCGFDRQNLAGEYCWGLKGMEERAKRIGAALVLKSSPGFGTEIETVVSGQGTWSITDAW